ncbi:hypothetical protein N7U49_41895 [Streptomyces sp. AD2-2]|nr:hypothetical protein N7U49_41895 [Streptomyces sp. AD2-2]
MDGTLTLRTAVEGARELVVPLGPESEHPRDVEVWLPNLGYVLIEGSASAGTRCWRPPSGPDRAG